MSKFSRLQSKFWRQQGDCCIFAEVHEILSDDGKTAELRLSWCRQLGSGWKVLGTENTRIRERDYPTWVTYFPRGELPK